MLSLIRFAFGHMKSFNFLLVLLFMSGVYAWIVIPKEANPDITIPYISVTASLEGISPDDAEKLIVIPIEREVKSVEGVKEVTAKAYEGGARVMLEFYSDVNIKDSLNEVRAAVDNAKPDMPSDMNAPEIKEYNYSLFPIIAVSIYGSIPEKTLFIIAEQLKNEIEKIPTVLEVDIRGEREEQVEIIVDPFKMESYGLVLNDVVNFVANNNSLVAAGSAKGVEGTYSIKVDGSYQDLDSVLKSPIKTVNGKTVSLKDVANVRLNYKDASRYARINGESTLTLSITKRLGTNGLETAEMVKKYIVGMEKLIDKQYPTLSDQIKISITNDTSETVTRQISDLENSVILSILLVMLAIYMTLGPKAAILVGVSVPGSFLTAVLIMYSIGFTLNTVTLFALILSVGMLVDGAIVVVEYAERRLSQGASAIQAWYESACKMAWPVTSSTATTIAAFLPLMFWPDTIGDFMFYLPATLIAVLSSSLAMALVFVPALAVSFSGKKYNYTDIDHKLAEGGEEVDIEIPNTRFYRFYAGLMRGVIDNPWKIVLLALLSLVMIWYLFIPYMGIKGMQFFVDVEPEEFQLQVQAPGNLSLDEKDTIVRDVESRLGFSEDTLSYTTTRVESNYIGKDGSDSLIGFIDVKLTTWGETKRESGYEFFDELSRRFKETPGYVVNIKRQEAGPPRDKPVTIELASKIPADLTSASDKVMEFLKTENGLINLENTGSSPKIDWQIKIDREKAALYGLSIREAGAALTMFTNGYLVSKYRAPGVTEDVDIVLRFPSDKRNLDQLDTLRVPSSKGYVPLSNFAERVSVRSSGIINRISGERTITITSDLEPDYVASKIIDNFKTWVEKNPLPDGVSFKVRGEGEDIAETGAFLVKAFIIAIALMYIILLTQFNSVYFSFLTLTAVILSTAGVAMGNMLTGTVFSVVMGGIAIISLAGIVVNNNIVLIDTYKSLESQCKSKSYAILVTGVQRLRPVLLTTITTVLGLVPMMIELGVDFINRSVSIGAPSAQFWSPLARGIGFGMIYSLFLTLLVTPAALQIRVNYLEKKEARRLAKEKKLKEKETTKK